MAGESLGRWTRRRSCLVIEYRFVATFMVQFRRRSWAYLPCHGLSRQIRSRMPSKLRLVLCSHYFSIIHFSTTVNVSTHPRPFLKPIQDSQRGSRPVVDVARIAHFPSSLWQRQCTHIQHTHPLVVLWALTFFFHQMLMNTHLGVEESPTSDGQLTVVHFIETSPTLLREMPWITLKEHKVSLPSFLPLFSPLFFLLPFSSPLFPLLFPSLFPHHPLSSSHPLLQLILVYIL